MSLLFALVILWAVHCMMIVAPPRPAPGRAGATILLATTLVLPICFAQAFLHLWPEAMSVPILAAILLASLLGFWWLLRNLEPRRLRDVRPPARRDGLATKASLQLNILAAVLVTALVAGLELVVAGLPAWRLTKLSVAPAAFMPAYVLARPDAAHTDRHRAGPRAQRHGGDR
jgi:hypothetical protein